MKIGGLTGVSRIDPVDVPAFFQQEVNAQLQVRARLYWYLPCEQLNASMLRSLRKTRYDGEQDEQAAEPSDIRADCHGDSLRAMKQPAKALCSEHQKKSAGF